MDEFYLEEKYIEIVVDAKGSLGKVFYFTGPYFPDRPTVLLLHGLSSNHLTWMGLMKQFSELKYNTIAPDLRAHGLSDKTRRRKLHLLCVMKEDLKSILIKEKVGCVHIVGYSWGGHISIDFASTWPEKVESLSLISTNHIPFYSYSSASFVIPFVTPLASWFLVLAGYLLIWQSKKTYHYFNPKQTRGYWSSTVKGLLTMPLSVNLWLLGEALRVDFRHVLHKITAPTLIIAGEHDPLVTKVEVEDMLKLIKKSEAVFLSNSAHYIATHHADRVNAHIIEFIQKVGSSKNSC